MGKIKEFLKKNLFILIILYWIMHSAWYTVLQNTTMSRNPYPIYHKLDSIIPFCEWFILPYVMWYFVILAVSIYLLLRNKERFVRFYTYMFGGMLVCMIVCTVVPMYFDRSNIVMYQNDNILTDFVKLLQGMDEPTTILPSMHVYVACGLMFAVAGDKKLGDILGKFAAVVFCIVICMATVFTKQHSVYDVLAAWILAVPMYYVAFKSRLPLRIL